MVLSKVMSLTLSLIALIKLFGVIADFSFSTVSIGFLIGLLGKLVFSCESRFGSESLT